MEGPELAVREDGIREDMGFEESDDIDLARTIGVVRRRAWLIGLLVVVAVVGAYVFSQAQPKQFRATVELNVVDTSASLFREIGTLTPQRDVENALRLLESDSVQDPALATLGGEAGKVETISADGDPETDIVTATVVATSASVAADAANAVAAVFIEQQEQFRINTRLLQAEQLRAISAELDEDVDRFDEQIDEAESRDDEDTAERLRTQQGRVISSQADLESRALELETQADIDSGAVSVLVPAEPPSGPFAPTPRRNALLAGGLAALLGIGLALAHDWLNSRVTDPEEAVELIGAPILGSIPLHSKRPRFGRSKLPDVDRIMVDPGTPAAEAYRGLCASVRFSSLGKQCHRIAVTSPLAGEGKTTIVANLARAVAEAGWNVVVVSTDLRRPRLGDLFDQDERERGVTSVLLGDAALADCVVPVSVDGGPTLAFLPAGPEPANPPALLGSEEFGTVLDQLERMGANLLLLDCPPVLPVSDTLAVAQQVDGVVVTAVPEQTRKRHLRDAVNRLKGVDAGILGLVLSGVSETARRYYKYPSYGEDEYGDGLDVAVDPETLPAARLHPKTFDSRAALVTAGGGADGPPDMGRPVVEADGDSTGGSDGRPTDGSG